jgi:hypothetical protein
LFFVAMISAPGWLEPLWQRLAADAPATVLLLAPGGHPLAAELPRRVPAARIGTAARLAEIPVSDSRYELAVVAGILETLADADARALLAALRDRLAARSVLWLDLARAPLGENDLRGLGFRLHAHDGTQLLASFDLYDYKDQPDWLNPRHWAHPELWNRFRW